MICNFFDNIRWQHQLEQVFDNIDLSLITTFSTGILGTKGDTELQSLHAVQCTMYQIEKRKKQYIPWFITYQASVQQTLYLR